MAHGERMMTVAPIKQPEAGLVRFFWWALNRVNMCLDCGRRYKGRHRPSFPSCLDCFLRKCAEFERRTGMVVGYGPVSKEVFKDDD